MQSSCSMTPEAVLAKQPGPHHADECSQDAANELPLSADHVEFALHRVQLDEEPLKRAVVLVDVRVQFLLDRQLQYPLYRTRAGG